MKTQGGPNGHRTAAEPARAGCGAAVAGSPLPRPTTSESHEFTANLKRAERRIHHVVQIDGRGTFMSPFWVALSDFKTFDSLSSIFDAATPTVVACLNGRLRRVDRNDEERYSVSLHAVAKLLEGLSAELAVVAASGSISGRKRTMPGSGAASAAETAGRSARMPRSASAMAAPPTPAL